MLIPIAAGLLVPLFGLFIILVSLLNKVIRFTDLVILDLNRRKFSTTEDELRPIASAARIGRIENIERPNTGTRRPAAIGISTELYPIAQPIFCLIFVIVFLPSMIE